MKKNLNIRKFLIEILMPIITMIIIGVLIYFYRGRLITTDPVPENVFIIPQELSQVSSYFSIIDAGFILSNVPTVNTTDNEFVVEGFLWFEYDPAHMSLEKIDKFSFLNGEIKYKSEPNVEARGNHLLVKYVVKIKFSSKLDYQMFPFDDHRIYFILTNLFLDPDDAIYVVPSVDFIVSKDVSIPGWVLKGHEVVFGKTPLIEGATGLHESYPQVIFILELEKNSLGIIFTIIIPLLIMFFVSLVSILQASVIGNFSKKVFNWDNYSISIGNLAAVLAYRFVIQTVSPDVGYLTVCDYFYIFVLGSTVISLMMPFIAIYVPRKLMRVISYVSISLLNLLLISLTYYLLFVRV